jgi:hypothetical protein
VASPPRTLSLFAVDLAQASDIHRRGAHADVLVRAPHGRTASLLSGDEPHPRELFDAVVEDLAAASLFDAPAAILAEAFASLAKVTRRPELELKAMEAHAAPAYPAELLDTPFVERSDAHSGLVILLGDPAPLEAAALGVKRALDLPLGAFETKDPALWRDLLESLQPVLLAASSGGRSLTAQRG